MCTDKLIAFCCAVETNTFAVWSGFFRKSVERLLCVRWKARATANSKFSAMSILRCRSCLHVLCLGCPGGALGLRPVIEPVSAIAIDAPVPRARPASIDASSPRVNVHPGLRTVTWLLPLLHNPNRFGIRLPVGCGNVWRTICELKQRFPGFILSVRVGWCEEDRIWDLHLCVDTDVEYTPDVELNLALWKEALRERFRQRSIYMKVSDPVRLI
mgnify:CR=1 FL=1